MSQQHTIAIITAPNASIPGALVVARGLYSRGNLQGVEVRQVEWVASPAGGCLERVTAALAALSGNSAAEARELETDPRGNDERTRLVIADNFWSSVRPACRRAFIRPDSIVTIRPGTTAPAGGGSAAHAGRLYLLDALRDRLPTVRVNLPSERLESMPDVVTAHEVRAAMREIQARPRLLDEETQSPGLDRGDVLLLALALAVHDLDRHHTSASVEPNTGRPRNGYARRGYSRA